MPLNPFMIPPTTIQNVLQSGVGLGHPVSASDIHGPAIGILSSSAPLAVGYRYAPATAPPYQTSEVAAPMAKSGKRVDGVGYAVGSWRTSRSGSSADAGRAVTEQTASTSAKRPRAAQRARRLRAAFGSAILPDAGLVKLTRGSFRPWWYEAQADSVARRPVAL